MFRYNHFVLYRFLCSLQDRKPRNKKNDVCEIVMCVCVCDWQYVRRYNVVWIFTLLDCENQKKRFFIQECCCCCTIFGEIVSSSFLQILLNRKITLATLVKYHECVFNTKKKKKNYIQGHLLLIASFGLIQMNFKHTKFPMEFISVWPFWNPV